MQRPIGKQSGDEDIEAYEQMHPEVLSEEARDEKVRGYFRARMKKKQTEASLL
jgi:hypothetical protein